MSDLIYCCDVPIAGDVCLNCLRRFRVPEVPHCRYGAECTRPDICGGSHRDYKFCKYGKNCYNGKLSHRAKYNHSHPPPAKRCRYGYDCRRKKTCRFSHPILMQS